MASDNQTIGLGHRIAPPRFLMFAGIACLAMPVAGSMIGWRQGVMAGFDLAAIIFLLSCIPLLGQKAAAMRAAATRNDANRAVMLGLTVGVVLVILVAIAAELSEKGAPKASAAGLVVATLALAWIFSNVIYALHYAHLFYLVDEEGKDQGGLSIPKTDEPDYWDMLYFSFTMGMTFQTSDVQIESSRIRRIATAHGLLAFVFNIGVLAFTINVLGG